MNNNEGIYESLYGIHKTIIKMLNKRIEKLEKDNQLLINTIIENKNAVISNLTYKEMYI